MTSRRYIEEEAFTENVRKSPFWQEIFPKNVRGTCVYHGGGEGENWHKLPWPISQRPGLEIVPAKEASLKKTVLQNTFYLASRHGIAFLNSMTTETVKKKARWCWRKDLAEFRGLTDRERTGFLLVLEWFENRVFSVPGGESVKKHLFGRRIF